MVIRSLSVSTRRSQQNQLEVSTSLLAPSPYGHKQEVEVSVSHAGSFIVILAIWTSPFRRGTPFGIRLAVWPGQVDIYLESVAILRAE